jgi:hypothetical protein
MTVKSVRKCCIPSEMDGSADSMLQNDNEEDESGSSKCKVDTVTLIHIFGELTMWN